MTNTMIEKNIIESVYRKILIESSQKNITWGDVRKIIYKTYNKSDVKKFCNMLISTGVNVFMDINFGVIAGTISQKSVDKVMKKLNNSSVTSIFLKLCKSTNAFGTYDKKIKKAIESLTDKALKETLDNMLEEMKSVKPDIKIESIKLKDLLNGFMGSINLKIDY